MNDDEARRQKREDDSMAMVAFYATAILLAIVFATAYHLTIFFLTGRFLT